MYGGGLKVWREGMARVGWASAMTSPWRRRITGRCMTGQLPDANTRWRRFTLAAECHEVVRLGLGYGCEQAEHPEAHAPGPLLSFGHIHDLPSMLGHLLDIALHLRLRCVLAVYG